MNQIPSVADQYVSRQVAAQAVAAVKAQPAPGDTPYLEPQTPDKFEETAQRHFRAMLDLMKETWRQMRKNRLGDEPSERFYARWEAHDAKGEVLTIDPLTGQEIPGVWYATLLHICGWQATQDLQRYASMKARKERDLQLAQLSDVYLEAA